MVRKPPRTHPANCTHSASHSPRLNPPAQPPSSAVIVPQQPKWHGRLAARLMWLVGNFVAATVRWRWRLGDVAFWDNRATQHYAIADYGDLPRRVQRVTVVGDLPVSLEGQTNLALKGDSA